MPRHKESRSPESHEGEARRAATDAFDRTLRELTPHTPATFFALGLSCAMLLLMAFDSRGGGLAQPFADETLAAWGANQPALTADYQGWRLFAAIFLPFWLLQLLFNGWTLLDLGRLMERVLGGVGFVLVYVTAGFAGNLAHTLWEPDRLVAGNTGALFGLLGALAGWLIRDRRAIPAAVTMRLRKSVPAFIAFNVGYGLIMHRIDAADYLGGVAAGLACGLVLARPLTLDGNKGRWRGNAVVALLVASLVVAAAYNISPPPSDVRAEQTRLADLEEQLQAIYEAGRTEERLSSRRFADAIDDEILLPWRAERGRLESLPRVAPDDRERWEELKRYASLREHAWAHLAEALRSGDKDSLKQAKQELTEADRVADELRKREPAEDSPAHGAAGAEPAP